MMTKEDYAAKIPDAAERENAARLFEAMCAAEDAAAAMRWNRPPEVEAALRELRNTYNAKLDELREWFIAEEGRLVPDQTHPLEAAAAAASDAYDAAPGGAILNDVDGVAVRCALSGVPIYDTDQTVDINSKLVLASLVLSPEQIAELTAEDEDELEEAA